VGALDRGPDLVELGIGQSVPVGAGSLHRHFLDDALDLPEYGLGRPDDVREETANKDDRWAARMGGSGDRFACKALAASS